MPNSTRAGDPQTATGKSKVSKNALTHGLRARKWLSPEEQADLNNLVEELTAEHQPQTATEHIMIERIAMGITKLRRLQAVEDAMYAKARGQASDLSIGKINRNLQLAEESAMPPIKVLDTLARYQTSLDRQISRAIGELMVIKEKAILSAETAKRSLTTVDLG